MSYSDKLNKLRGRRIPFSPALESFAFNEAQRRDYEVYNRINRSDSIRYAIGAMQRIDPEYTENTFNEGERVKNHLINKLPLRTISAEYRYQGSVTSDTHIKSHSDIDLLTIHSGFVTLEPPQKVSIPYTGNPVDDLVKLRNESADILKKAFPEVYVDESGSKSISLSGGSLRRKVDVVASNWYDTNLYKQTGFEYHRGIMILKNDDKTRPINQPFFHNKKIDDRDISVYGNLRKSIRLMKSVRYDSDKEINVSSYDICALAYNMPDRLLEVPMWMELQLVENCTLHLANIITDQNYRDSLVVPDGSRKIFGTPGATLEGVTALFGEMYNLKNQIEQDLKASNSTIKREHVYY